MKSKFILSLIWVLSGFLTNCFGAADATRAQLERMAQTYSYFSPTVVVRNGELRLVPRSGITFAEEQQRLVAELRRLSADHESLAILLKDANPKVRTLALGAIFQREDGRDLPLMANLINDPAPTFPNLHEVPHSWAGDPLATYENPQTVGDVVDAMLAYWGVPQTGRAGKLGGGPFCVTTNDFAEYWKRHAGREYSASWFAVKMKRATRQTIPILPQYRSDIDPVVAEIKALPMPDRAWIQLYVLAPEGWFEREPEDSIATDDELIATVKTLDPRSRLRFLQREKVSDDPDLLMDKDDIRFIRMSNFLLRHADQLLRPEDADALLTSKYVLRQSGGVNPAWAIGAALVQPARASEILHKALLQETKNNDDAGRLAGALWRIRGSAEMDFLVNWFYGGLPTASEPVYQPVALLWEVEAEARPDTKVLIAALMNDPRFDRTDWVILSELLKMVNVGRSAPLVKVSDIADAQPNGLEDVRMVYPVWRNLLRREYGLPEKPLPAPLAVPEKVLTQPAWSEPVPTQEDRGGPWHLVLSPDGQWLALLSHEIVTLWRADTGRFAWQPAPSPARPDGYPTVAGDVAFTAAGQLLIFDFGDYGRFRMWDLGTHQETNKVLLYGKPNSGVDEGRYSFDGTAKRMAFAGYGDLGCFDTRTGAALWMHLREGGVGIPTALSGDGTRLAVGGGTDFPRGVRLYDAITGERLGQFDKLAGQVLTLTISNNGQRLVTVTAEDGLQLWDCATGKTSQSYGWRVPGWKPGPPVFSSDGQWLAAVGSSSAIGAHEIGVFDTVTGQLKWVIRFQTGSSFGADLPLAFSPDGKFLYIATDRIEAWALK